MWERKKERGERKEISFLCDLFFEICSFSLSFFSMIPTTTKAKKTLFFGPLKRSIFFLQLSKKKTKFLAPSFIFSVVFPQKEKMSSERLACVTGFLFSSFFQNPLFSLSPLPPNFYSPNKSFTSFFVGIRSNRVSWISCCQNPSRKKLSSSWDSSPINSSLSSPSLS